MTRIDGQTHKGTDGLDQHTNWSYEQSLIQNNTTKIEFMSLFYDKM